MSSDDSDNSEKPESTARALVWAFNVSSGALGGSSPAMGFGSALRIHMDAIAEQESKPSPVEKDLVSETESAQTRSVRGTFDELLHRRVETISPVAFLEGAKKFLATIGLNGPTRIEVNLESVPRDGQMLPLSEALVALGSYLDQHKDEVKTIDIGSHGMNSYFDVRLTTQYLRKHKVNEPSIRIEVNALYRKLGPTGGESFLQYKERMKNLDKDRNTTSALYSEIEARKKELFQNLTRCLKDCFPNLKADVYEEKLIDSF